MRLALLLVFLPPAAATTLACNCAETGSPVEIASSTLDREPELRLTGDARLECMRRDKANRCDVYWIVPAKAGTVTIALDFPDGVRVEDVIEYGTDDAYPCRGNIRPVHDHITRF
ncbi:MAG: hypothetical protein KIT84_03155 [Labilithrix sp.]|nr:hypothetical protein [Labilithrix sp.]MCW5809980.1 hypothetical protein [Labilithrix sp.]